MSSSSDAQIPDRTGLSRVPTPRLSQRGEGRALVFHSCLWWWGNGSLRVGQTAVGNVALPL